MMGCVQNIMEDRFSAQLQEIYKKGIKFILWEIGKEFDSLPYLGPENDSFEKLFARNNINEDNLNMMAVIAKNQKENEKKIQDNVAPGEAGISNFKRMSLTFQKKFKLTKRNSDPEVKLEEKLRQMKIFAAPYKS